MSKTSINPLLQQRNTYLIMESIRFFIQVILAVKYKKSYFGVQRFIFKVKSIKWGLKCTLIYISRELWRFSVHPTGNSSPLVLYIRIYIYYYLSLLSVLVETKCPLGGWRWYIELYSSWKNLKIYGSHKWSVLKDKSDTIRTRNKGCVLI